MIHRPFVSIFNKPVVFVFVLLAIKNKNGLSDAIQFPHIPI